MFTPIILILMIFSMASFFAYAQEGPPAGVSAEEWAAREKEIRQSQEFKDVMRAQMTMGNFTGDPESAEFKKLSDDFNEKTDLFNKKFALTQQEPEQDATLEKTAETTTVATSENIPTQQLSAQEVSAPENPTKTSTENVSTPQAPEEEFPTEEAVATEVPAEIPAEKASTLEAPAAAQPEITAAQEAPAAATETPQELIAPSEPILEETITVPEEPIASEEPVGIDTVSLENPQGNWLFKRIWWERAEERYEKIRLMVDSIWESRNKFFYERNQLDRNVLDPFYINIGIDRGELQIMLSEIKDFIEKQHENENDLSEQERMLITEEERLKQLKTDVDMITNLDHAIDDALGTFMNQINRVRNYEAEAWKNFKEIAHILNDTRARELYYMIEGAARNIKTISIYLEQEFFTHFNKLINDAKSRVARVQSQMDALKEKGVIFQRQTEQSEEQTAQKDETQEEEEEVTKPKKSNMGWFDWISSGISDVLGYVWSIIRLPYDLIFGK